MDSLDLCLPKALSKLNLLEQYKLNTLVHKWRDVVGDVIAEHTKIVSIKPPDMVISADNSMWMQELQMQKRRIIEAINKYYHQEVIKDIRFIMKRQSYVKADINTSISLPDKIGESKKINFADIVLSKEDVEAIDKSLEKTDNEELKAAFRKVEEAFLCTFILGILFPCRLNPSLPWCTPRAESPIKVLFITMKA